MATSRSEGSSLFSVDAGAADAAAAAAAAPPNLPAVGAPGRARKL